MQCVRGLPQLLKSRSLKQNAQHAPETGSDDAKEWPADPSAYEMLGQAGKGAHAVVYRARCVPLDELVAVKKLSLDSNSNWDLTALVREATIMRGLHHPHLLPLHTSFVAGRQLWFVTPFMALGSARAVMKRHFSEGLDEVAIATIMRYVLLGLEYVHKNSGIHRDVKADNILLSEDGRVVLADFGVAAARRRDPSLANLDMAAVMATTFVGTPCWMAPEVMEQQDGYDTAADIWSVGITLIELATGRPPLARLHPMRVLLHTLQQPPPCLQDGSGTVGRHYSKVLKEAVEVCLQKDPAARPSASCLLGHRFFKTIARDSAWLARHFASQLPAGCGAAAGGGSAAAGCAMRGPSMFFKDGMSFAAAAGRLKSAWVFPPQQQQQLQPHQEQQEGGCCEALWREPAAASAAAAGKAAAQAAEREAELPAAAGAAVGEGRCVVEVMVLPPAGQQKQKQQQEQEEKQQQQQQLQVCHHSSRLLRKAASAGAAGSSPAADQSPGGTGNVVRQLWGEFVRVLSRGSSRGSRDRGSWSSSISSGGSAVGEGTRAATAAAGAGDATADTAGTAEQAVEQGLEEDNGQQQQRQLTEPEQRQLTEPEEGRGREEEEEEDQGPQHQRRQRPQQESFSVFAERPRNLPAWCDGSRH